MKKIANFIKYFALGLLVLIACTKDFDGLIVEDFPFAVKTNDVYKGYVSGKINTDFEIVPEKKVEDTKFQFKYEIIEGEGLFKDQDDYAIRPKTFITLDKLNFSYDFVPSVEGKIVVKIIVHSNNQKVEKVLTYTAEVAPFVFSANAKGRANVSEKTDLLLTLEENKSNPSGTYKIQYDLKNPNIDVTIFEKENLDNPLKKGTYVPFKKDTQYVLTSDTEGEQTIYLSLRNQHDIIKKDSVQIHFQNMAFVLTADAEKTKVSVKNRAEIVFFIDDSAKQNRKYQMFFSRKKGEGKLYDAKWNPQRVNTPFEVEKGNFSMFYVPDEEGEHMINFRVIDDLGSERDVELTLTAEGTYDGFQVFADNVNYQLGDKVGINFNYSHKSNDKIQFTSNRNGQLLYEGQFYKNGQMIPLNQNVSNAVFIPEEVGDYKLQFTLYTGKLQKIASASFQIFKELTNDGQEKTFNLSVASEYSVIKTNKENTIYILLEDSEEHTTIYDTKFVMEGVNGKVYDEHNNRIYPNTFVKLPKGNTRWYVIAENSGNINLKITSKNGASVEKTAQVNIKIDNNADEEITNPANWFRFSAEPEQSSIKVGEENPINMLIESQSQQTYQAKFKIEGVNGKIYGMKGNRLQTNEYVPMHSGNTQWKFVGDNTGEATITITVKNNHGVERTYPVKIKVDNNSFVFNAIKTKNTALVNEKVQVNINLDGVTNERYQMYFTSSKAGKVVYQGMTYSAGEMINVLIGGSFLYYQGSEEGIHDIAFKVKAGIREQSSNVKIDFSKNSFEFNAVRESSIVKVGDNTYVDLNIKEYAGTSTYQIKYIPNGVGITLYDNNNRRITPGEYIPIETGNTRWRIVPNEAGNVDVLFTLQSKGNDTKTAKVTFESKNEVAIDNPANDFAFSAEAEQSAVKINQRVHINMLTEARNQQTYQAKFRIEGVNGKIYNSNGELLKTNVYIPVDKGNVQWSFVGETNGEATITITVKNNHGVEKTYPVKIKVDNNSFVFNAIKTKNTALVNEKVQVNINLDGVTNERYQMYFTSSKAGKVVYQGMTYSAGEMINVLIGGSFLYYQGSEEGIHDIAFKVKAGIREQSSNVKIDFSKNSFEFNAVRESSIVKVGDNTYVDLNIKEYAGTSTYQIKYIPNGVGITLYDNNNRRITPGEYIPIETGNTRWRIVPNEAGNVDVLFTLQSKGNDTKTAKVTFESKNEVAIDNPANDFAFSAEAEQSAVKINQRVHINMLTEARNQQTYQAKFRIEGVNGKIYNSNGELLKTNMYIPVDKGNVQWSFVGETNGEATITITVKNNHGVEKTYPVKIKVDNGSFTFSAVKTKSSALLNEEIQVNLILEGMPNERYQMSYESNKGSTITYRGKVYSPGETMPIPDGGSFLYYEGTEEGNHSIVFRVKSNLGVEQRSNVSLIFASVNYDFNAVREASSVSIGSDVYVDLNIKEYAGASSYQIHYIPSGASISMYDENNRKITPGQDQNIRTGNTRWRIVPNEAGNISIDFNVQNATNVRKTAKVSINALQKDYQLTASTANKEEIVNTPLEINLAIREIGSGGSTYKAYFKADNQGYIIYNGKNYRAGETFDINVGNNTLSYIGEKEGNHNITFHTISSTELTKQANVSLTYNPKSFTFSATPRKKTIYKDEIVPINFEIKEIGGVGTYKLKYVIKSETNAEIYKDIEEIPMGVSQDVPGSAFQWRLKGTQVGKLTIEFILTNDRGVEKTETIIVNVSNKDFIFEAYGGSATYVNNMVDISVNLEEYVPGGRYTMYFSSDGAGELYQESTKYISGQNFPITVGSHRFQYKGLAVGNHQIKLTIRDENNNQKIQDIAIRFNQIDYKLSGVAEKQSITVGQSTRINFQIEEDGGNSEGYQIKWQNTGATGAIKNEKVENITQGIYVPLDKKVFFLLFAGNESGTANITFTVKNSTGTEKTVNVRIGVTQVNYTFSVVPNERETSVGQKVVLNTNLQESNGTSSYYVTVTSNRKGNVYYDENMQYLGESFYYDKTKREIIYKGNEEGQHNVRVSIVSRGNVTKEANIVLTFIQKSFSFTAKPRSTEVYKNQKQTIDAQIQEDEGANLTYNMRFNSNRTGKIIYGGKTYSINQDIPVSKGNFTFEYLGEEVGTHDVTLKIIPSKGSQKEVRVSIPFKKKDFSFTANPAVNQIIIGQETDINFAIQENGGQSSYQVKYEISGIGETLKIGDTKLIQGIYTSVPSKNFTMKFSSNKIGTNNITFKVKNDENTEKTVSKSISVQDRTYTLNVTTNSTEELTGKEVPINVRISENGSTGHKYTLTFKDGNKGGQLKYNGGTYSHGSTISNLSAGNYQMYYISNQAGQKTVEITAKSDYNKENSQSVSFKVKEDTYSVVFNNPTPGMSDRIHKDNPFIIGLNINPDDRGSNSNYKVKFATSKDVDLLISYNGANYTVGQLIPISKGTTNFTAIVRKNKMPLDNDFYTDFFLNYEITNDSGIKVSHTNALANKIKIYKPIKLKIETWEEQRELNYWHQDLYAIVHRATTDATMSLSDYKIILTYAWNNDGGKLYTKEKNLSELTNGGVGTQWHVQDDTRYENRYDRFVDKGQIEVINTKTNKREFYIEKEIWKNNIRTFTEN
ncbi:TraQ conjugal transfer family protein [Capnocytophaga canis]|uniref:TraQ conjugal transfer family protein n=1 Tax=Capnocytophaga canis TaxID=1848903 RepID=UPI0037D17CEB